MQEAKREVDDIRRKLQNVTEEDIQKALTMSRIRRFFASIWIKINR